MELTWKYQTDRKKEREVVVREEAGVPYLSFRALEELRMVKNGFSTRFGGASKGKFATMNFSYSRGDDPKAVLENYTRMARALGVERDRMVVSWQTHTTNIRQVTSEDLGKGVIRERDYREIDGLITDVPGATLVTFYADCVPLYFVDPVHRAIGLSHSGWRGTVAGMSEKTVHAMQEAFGTSASDLVVCIGPSICKDCFEVGLEVAEEFARVFPEQVSEVIFPGVSEEKRQVDLWAANRIVLERAGVLPEHIHITDLCTKCNHENLFSHRVMGEERGNAGAFLGLE